MSAGRRRALKPGASPLHRAAEQVRRAFSEFLTIPTLTIVGFLALAALMYRLDHLREARGWPALIPGDHQSIRTLLGTIATSIITVTSITFSLLLLAVQQGAASLTAQVYDQFLRRRANQAYFGFFTGLALYALVVLATVYPGYTPIYSAILGFVLTVVALYLLILLIYSTIDQMRPVMIVENIRDHSIAARERQLDLLERTVRSPRVGAFHSVPVEAIDSGFLASFDPDALAQAARDCGPVSEVIVSRHIGDYVSVGQQVAELRFIDPPGEVDVESVRDCLPLEEQRDLVRDPGFGVDQLVTIGWTAASTSKSNPHPAILACWNLRDLVATWFEEPKRAIGEGGDGVAVVYRDNVPAELLAAFESLTVVASESLQHQTLAATYEALALAARRMPRTMVGDIEGVVARSLSALGEHVLTAVLDGAIDDLGAALREVGGDATALEQARARLRQSHERLGSRSTRVG